MEYKVRDLRDRFFLVDDTFFNGHSQECGVYCCAVYMVLCRHAGKDQSCFPSKRTIADRLNISERTVYSAIKTLEKWNIIKIESRGRKNDGSYKSLTYYLLDKSQWKAIPSACAAEGKKKPSPSANDDKTRRQQVPNKETHNNKTHSKIRQEIQKLRNKLINKDILKKDFHMEQQTTP